MNTTKQYRGIVLITHLSQTTDLREAVLKTLLHATPVVLLLDSEGNVTAELDAKDNYFSVLGEDRDYLFDEDGLVEEARSLAARAAAIVNVLSSHESTEVRGTVPLVNAVVPIEPGICEAWWYRSDWDDNQWPVFSLQPRRSDSAAISSAKALLADVTAALHAATAQGQLGLVEEVLS